MTRASSPPPNRPPLLESWHTRDLPVLLEIARALDAGTAAEEHRITDDLAITSDELDAARQALRDGEYLRVLKTDLAASATGN